MCAASKAKAAESDAAPPNKKAKTLNTTKTPGKKVKQEAADHASAACPDLSNAPTHGPDEPLLLDFSGNDEGAYHLVPFLLTSPIWFYFRHKLRWYPLTVACIACT